MGSTTCSAASTSSIRAKGTKPTRTFPGLLQIGDDYVEDEYVENVTPITMIVAGKTRHVGRLQTEVHDL